MSRFVHTYLSRINGKEQETVINLEQIAFIEIKRAGGNPFAEDRALLHMSDGTILDQYLSDLEDWGI